MYLYKTFWILFILLTVLLFHEGHSQQSALYSQYMFNGLLINPAYAGSQESMSVSGLFRKQWTTLDGSPSTQNLTAHTPLNNKKIALGLILQNDNIGVAQQTSVDAIYAYRISFSETRKLSFGLQAGYARLSAQYNTLAVKDPNDPSFSSSAGALNYLYFGTGIYYSSKRFYAGLSSPHANRTTIGNSLSADESRQSRNYFFTTGYVFTLSPAFKLKPSTLLKATDGLTTQVDLNCTLQYEDVFWVGVSYRTFSALSFMAKVQLTNQLSAGYAYDKALGNLNVISGAGHEFMLTYNFSFFKSNTITPRDF
ncbi:MAG: rane protein [Chitinophagaceae bacterium]|nr:rane protein [Chitinophagaceae bacterium]